MLDVHVSTDAIMIHFLVHLAMECVDTGFFLFFDNFCFVVAYLFVDDEVNEIKFADLFVSVSHCDGVKFSWWFFKDVE